MPIPYPPQEILVNRTNSRIRPALLATLLVSTLACNQSSATAAKATPPEEAKLKAILIDELNRAAKEDPLQPTSEPLRAQMDLLHWKLTNQDAPYSAPAWLPESWAVMDRLNPSGGWIHSLDLQITEARHKALEADHKAEEASNSIVSCTFYLKRQFSRHSLMGSWEMVVKESSGGYAGTAVLEELEPIVSEKRFEGRINYNVPLKRKGRQTFVETNSGPMGSSEVPRVLPVYEIAAESIPELKKATEEAGLEVKQAEKLRAEAATRVRQAALQALGHIPRSSPGKE
jgi:hypothetical protein